jgi:hypothetical protein
VKAIKELSLPILQLPRYPTAKAGATIVDPGKIFLWKQDVAVAKRQTIQLEENMMRMNTLIIGQCSSDLNIKLQGSAAFVQTEDDQDVVQLLLVIQVYCCHIQ